MDMQRWREQEAPTDLLHDLIDEGLLAESEIEMRNTANTAWKAYCDLLHQWQVNEKLSGQAISDRAQYMVEVTCAAHPGNNKHHEQLAEYLRSLIALIGK